MKKNISKKVKQNPATLTAELQNNPEFINLEKEIATSAQNKKKEVDEKVEQDLMKLSKHSKITATYSRKALG